jgi:O-succinylbenzoate synthase
MARTGAAADNPLSLTQSSIYRYRLACVRPLELNGATLRQRQGLIVQLRDDQDHQGLGEVAPLPGFSRETPEQALAQLRRWCEAPSPISLGSDGYPWQEANRSLYPSVRMGLEMALCELYSQRRGLSLSRFLNPDCSTATDALPVCPLLSGDNEHIFDKARALGPHAGLTEIKLKIGRQPPEDDARLLHQLGEILGERVRFRLDANRRWSYEEARRFAHLVPGERVVYIEEPTPRLASSRRFCAEAGFGLALDETLQDPNFVLEPFLVPELAALVIKPTLCGGLERSMQLIGQAEALGLLCVVSSSFESSLGIAQLGELAAALTPTQLSGLDTLTAFAADIVRPADPRLAPEPRELIPLAQLERVWQGSSAS